MTAIRAPAPVRRLSPYGPVNDTIGRQQVETHSLLISASDRELDMFYV